MTRAVLLRSVWFAVTALFAVALAMATLACGPGERGEPPHAWVAVPQPLVPGTAPKPIRVFDAFSPGEQRDFGPPGQYAALKWSPDAHQLGAFDLPDGGPPRFLLFDQQSGREREVALPDTVRDYAWSPDSSRIAVATRGTVVMLDRNGREIGRMDIPPLPDGSESGASLSASNWSPGSRYFAARRNNHLIVMDRNGHGGAYVPPAFVSDISPPSVQFLRWISARQFIVRVPLSTGDIPLRGWGVTISARSLAWRPKQLSPDDLAPARVRKLVDDASEHFGHSGYQTRLSAEGTALLVEVRRETTPGKHPEIVIFHNGQETPVDLGVDPGAPYTPLVRSLDVVITGRR